MTPAITNTTTALKVMASANSVEYKDKIIAFVDVLGFKQLVEQSANGSGMALAEILSLLEAFGGAHERIAFEQDGPYICPCAKFIERNLDFRATQLSDCVIASAEVSPAGVINLLSHCAKIVLRLLKHGVMCRGYVTRGLVYHVDNQIIGTGYQSAYAGEAGVTAFKREADERGTPFLEVDRSVSDYVMGCEDECVKTIYERIVKCDGEVSAIFPFLIRNNPQPDHFIMWAEGG
ncbi:MAG: hypothetical protein ACT4P0_11550 [Panacagrimonas sp.]